MAILKTKTLMLTIASDKLSLFLKVVLKEKLPIEILNPVDLGSEWSNLEYIKPD